MELTLFPAFKCRSYRPSDIAQLKIIKLALLCRRMGLCEMLHRYCSFGEEILLGSPKETSWKG
jgi:hypothetical protein